MEVEISQQQQKTALEGILASETFEKSPNLSKLLTYLCEKCWAGESDDLKEYNLGTEALGRPADFDPSTNAIVRVEAHRLREKLKKYYENEGMQSPIAIMIQPGSYVPHFVVRPKVEDSATGEQASDSKTQEATLEPLERPKPEREVPVRTPIFPEEAPAAHLPPKMGRKSIFLLGVLAAIVLAFAAWRLLLKPVAYGPSPAALRGAAMGPSHHAIAAQSRVRIIAGYLKKDYVDRSGNTWSGDAYFDRGGTDKIPPHFIYRASDPTLFQTYRHGNFSYNIPLKPGDYELWLYFIETRYGPGTLVGGGEISRLFDVDINGKTLLNTFDIFADSGGDYVADVRTFKNITPARDGFLHIQFVRRRGSPVVSAIKILPSAPGKLRPIRIVAQETSFTDHNGLKWNPDEYYRDGRLVERRSPVSGTTNPGLFQGERYGNFDYAIPVASGKYSVTLYFSERYFGPGMPGGGGVGSRVFDVVCNGTTLLKNFDIFKEAGGPNLPVVKTFGGLEPDAQGKLVLSFVPRVNYALVDAIQVRDESR